MDELNERNKEISILKGETSKQINQIKESITKFLDKETGTFGERIRTLFKEQGITIVTILTSIGMAIGVIIEANENQVIIPGTTKLIFNISLVGTDANTTLVKNLGRNIIRNSL